MLASLRAQYENEQVSGEQPGRQPDAQAAAATVLITAGGGAMLESVVCRYEVKRTCQRRRFERAQSLLGMSGVVKKPWRGISQDGRRQYRLPAAVIADTAAQRRSVRELPRWQQTMNGSGHMLKETHRLRRRCSSPGTV